MYCCPSLIWITWFAIFSAFCFFSSTLFEFFWVRTLITKFVTCFVFESMCEEWFIVISFLFVTWPASFLCLQNLTIWIISRQAAMNELLSGDYGRFILWCPTLITWGQSFSEDITSVWTASCGKKILVQFSLFKIICSNFISVFSEVLY